MTTNRSPAGLSLIRLAYPSFCFSTWALIEGYHAVGKRILEEKKNFSRAQIYGQEIASRVSQSLNKSRRTIERAVQFAEKFPDLNALPEGKDTTWHRICNLYLVEHREPDPGGNGQGGGKRASRIDGEGRSLKDEGQDTGETDAPSGAKINIEGE